MNILNFLILLITSMFSGYTIGIIGKRFGIPVIVSMILSAIFGWLLGGAIQL